jgi:hypothetical protein
MPEIDMWELPRQPVTDLPPFYRELINTCDKCGCLFIDVDLHWKWHDQLERGRWDPRHSPSWSDGH